MTCWSLPATTDCVQPNSAWRTAISAICSGECVRAFVGFGFNRPIGQISRGNASQRRDYAPGRSRYRCQPSSGE
jgi:hypothetical protein